MKQTLELRIGQRLTMTPQLQHAIKLLQLSGVELLSEMQEALEANPLLEEKEQQDDHGETDGGDRGGNGESKPEENEASSSADLGELAFDSETGKNDSLELDIDAEVEVEQLEPDWDQRQDLHYSGPIRNSSTEDTSMALDARNSKPTTLKDHLLWQMQMTPFSASDLKIAHSIIESVDNEGYLTSDLSEILDIVNENDEYSLDEIQAVLHQVQNFDPVGVAARNLRESLLIQLRHLNNATPWRDEAIVLVEHHLKLLASKDYSQLKRVMQLSTNDLHSVITLIQSLNPRPGNVVSPNQAPYVIPDIAVKKIRGRWRASLNNESYPELKINQQYRSLIKRGDSSDQNKYLQDHLQEARWFIKSLKNRNETLLKVASAIIERQQDFFECGEEAMKPLVLHDIAETLGMHESTISRATTHKFMLTPKGIFELKYFFSSHVNTADGGTCSATAIRSLIRKIVDTEPSTKPVSDSKIVTILKDRGIHVARRTVAKYREHMNIPPSNQRKSLL